jgi:CheY-like chemotaxis protein
VNKREKNAAPMVASFERSRPTILIVDDEPLLLEVASAYLEQMNYHTLIADGPQAALRILGGEAIIDVLFSDIRMPGKIDGFELAILGRALRPTLKVILTSAYSWLDDEATVENKLDHCSVGDHKTSAAKKYVGHVAQSILHKPYSAKALAKKMQQALQG